MWFNWFALGLKLPRNREYHSESGSKRQMARDPTVLQHQGSQLPRAANCKHHKNSNHPMWACPPQVLIPRDGLCSTEALNRYARQIARDVYQYSSAKHFPASRNRAHCCDLQTTLHFSSPDWLIQQSVDIKQEVQILMLFQLFLDSLRWARAAFFIRVEASDAVREAGHLNIWIEILYANIIHNHQFPVGCPSIRQNPSKSNRFVTIIIPFHDVMKYVCQWLSLYVIVIVWWFPSAALPLRPLLIIFEGQRLEEPICSGRLRKGWSLDWACLGWLGRLGCCGLAEKAKKAVQRRGTSKSITTVTEKSVDISPCQTLSRWFTMMGIAPPCAQKRIAWPRVSRNWGGRPWSQTLRATCKSRKPSVKYPCLQWHSRPWILWHHTKFFAHPAATMQRRDAGNRSCHGTSLCQKVKWSGLSH